MPSIEDEIRKLQQQLDSHDRLINGIKRDPYLIAHQVFGSLTFFREFGPHEFQAHLQQVVGMLRTWGTNVGGAPGYGKFLIGLADLIEEGNRTGGWPGLKGKD